MRAIMVHENGGPEVLTVTDLSEPEAGPGQVVVRVEAIGVSVVEAHMRAGILPIPLPAVLGVEAAGQVVAVGAGVDPSLVGTAVAGVTGGVGAYAELVAMTAAMTAPIPAGVSAVDAVAAGAAGAVALGLMHNAGLRGGETVLVEAGASNVGGYLLQLAREFGAGRVLATAGAEAKRDLASSLGATRPRRSPRTTCWAGAFRWSAAAGPRGSPRCSPCATRRCSPGWPTDAPEPRSGSPSRSRRPGKHTAWSRAAARQGRSS